MGPPVPAVRCELQRHGSGEGRLGGFTGSPSQLAPFSGRPAPAAGCHLSRASPGTSVWRGGGGKAASRAKEPQRKQWKAEVSIYKIIIKHKKQKEIRVRLTLTNPRGMGLSGSTREGCPSQICLFTKAKQTNGIFPKKPKVQKSKSKKSTKMWMRFSTQDFKVSPAMRRSSCWKDRQPRSFEEQTPGA